MKKLFMVGILFAGQMSFASDAVSTKKSFNLEDSIKKPEKYAHLKSIKGFGSKDDVEEVYCDSILDLSQKYSELDRMHLISNLIGLTTAVSGLNNTVKSTGCDQNSVIASSDPLDFTDSLKANVVKPTEDAFSKTEIFKLEVIRSVSDKMTTPKCDKDGQFLLSDFPQSFKDLVENRPVFVNNRNQKKLFPSVKEQDDLKSRPASASVSLDGLIASLCISGIAIGFSNKPDCRLHSGLLLGAAVSISQLTDLQRMLYAAENTDKLNKEQPRVLSTLKQKAGIESTRLSSLEPQEYYARLDQTTYDIKTRKFVPYNTLSSRE